ncbi:MAG: NAD(P)-binding protein [Ignavibacteriae bacterium]|nr:NAD(P)-binding protein [Ignavibacteriota bacterium]
MAGYGAASRLSSEGRNPIIFEKNNYLGGHTTSFYFEGGYIFDDGPHISFTNDERIQKIFAESVKGEYETIKAYVNNYWKGQWIKHPAQCNLYGLPNDLVVKILLEFSQLEANNLKINNYEDWLKASYGKVFAETFPMEYGFKYHTTEASNMSIDWLGPRLYQPDLEEVIRGALSPSTPEVHYVSNFRYPTHNGFVSYLNPLPSLANIKINHKAIEIDADSKTIKFKNGTIEKYDSIISSIPLTELIPIIKQVPKNIVEAASKLACTQCVVVNIGLDRSDISEATWSYFYDRDIIFTRLSFPHMLSPNNVPDGKGSIQAEIYFSEKYKPIDKSIDNCIKTTITDLKRCGLIKEDDNITFKNGWLIPYAQVIFDLERKKSLKIVRDYLDEIKISVCGRYGEWEYFWTDESFISGENAAQRVLDSSKA